MLCLYLSLFHTSQRDRYMIFVCCGSATAYNIAFQAAFLTQYQAIWQGWKPMPGGQCRSGFPAEVNSIGLNISLETAITLCQFSPFRSFKCPSGLTRDLFIASLRSWSAD
ncbi:hypothetical protein BDV38DRAFT_233755 [Aspergillus pseudotamarii]|uniref:Uncharacterized protein n=1 Tax=Aspergillus pseudotamarii TaxID=132259 RepID=A0A5N6TAN9_ASPPS|nr:uncharacterized protein BDV38DRAFT_233755 [Aspergillus pseudotamarii]KAE8143448.1 hypothetical protein BDV38DRAFT_233755 [Aspergillus pseudotamarii]